MRIKGEGQVKGRCGGPWGLKRQQEGRVLDGKRVRGLQVIKENPAEPKALLELGKGVCTMGRGG